MAIFSPGVPYFPFASKRTRKINDFISVFGLKGYGVLIVLLQEIYANEGYFIPLNQAVALVSSRSLNIGANFVAEIVRGLIKRDIFDKEKFEKFNILTSLEIQENYLNAVKKREFVEFDKDYLYASIISKLLKITENKGKNEKNIHSRENSSINKDNTLKRESIYTEPLSDNSKLSVTKKQEKPDITQADAKPLCGDQLSILPLKSVDKIQQFKNAFPSKIVETKNVPDFVDIDLLIENFKKSWFCTTHANVSLDTFCKKSKYQKLISGGYQTFKQTPTVILKSNDNKLSPQEAILWE